MKKLISLLLVVMMLCSISTVAFAADSNASIGYSTATNNTKDSTNKNSAMTELYLQVDAAGQIDVTVPLVLVFKTNIDGGNADTASNYVLTSASSADLVVTKVQVVVNPETEGNLVADSNPMKLVPYATNLADDTYGVKITVAEQTDAAGQPRAKFEKNVRTEIVPENANTGYVSANPKDGGLFLVKKDTTTPVVVDMITGDLSFVTTRNDEDSAPHAGYGVKLLTVTYTVAIDTSDAIGTAHNGGTINFPTATSGN